jgi:hypothetical protein
MWQWRCFGIANLLKTLHDLYVAALSEGVSFGERLVVACFLPGQVVNVNVRCCVLNLGFLFLNFFSNNLATCIPMS